MKKSLCLLLALTILLAGCQTIPPETTAPPETKINGATQNGDWENVTHIALDGSDVYVEEGAGVCTGHDIVYYEAGHDFTYGEGLSADEHDAAAAEAHTVVHITQPGTYRISGSFPAGQIAVDLGADAAQDPDAVVTLILDGVDITCKVAPAIIFYHVYECGSTDTETAGPVVDTSGAGANVIIADGSVNTVNGSYVAKIYKPDSVVLNEDGTKVEEAKKLHKYDAAFYSRMSMNVSGGELGDGVLTINAENEGLDSELHLTINGGNITINSGNDGINTNEDGVSVTTVNGGSLTIHVNGSTGEGDGIDSNGWLVINGGRVISAACGFSGDAGLDSDMGIYINGGTVMASGNMLDRIAGGDGTYAVFQFDGTLPGGTALTLKNEAGETVLECAPANDFSCLILSGEDLIPGTYSFWMGGTQLEGVSGGTMGGPGFFGGGDGNLGTPGNLPGRFEGEPPEGDYQIPPQPTGEYVTQGEPAGQIRPQTDGEAPPAMPEGATMPSMPKGQTPPEGMDQLPQGDRFGGAFRPSGEASVDFVISAGGNQFVMVGPAGE